MIEQATSPLNPVVPPPDRRFVEKAIRVLVALIVVKTSLTMYQVLNVVVGSIAVAALTTLVYSVLEFVFSTRHQTKRLSKVLWFTTLWFWIPLMALLAGAELNRDELIAEHYLEAVNTYSRQVFEHRMAELIADATEANCAITGPSSRPNKRCQELRKKYQSIRALRTPAKLESESILDFCRRAYVAAMENECDSPAHLAELDTLRKQDPRQPVADPATLVCYVFRNWPYWSSVRTLSFALLMVLMHAVPFMFHEVPAETAHS